MDIIMDHLWWSCKEGWCCCDYYDITLNVHKYISSVIKTKTKNLIYLNNKQLPST